MGVVTHWQGGTAHMTGYPASAGGAQTDQLGTICGDPSYSVFDYGTLSASPGNSGGPIWLNDNGSDDVAGVVSTAGWACQLTTADLNEIFGWVGVDAYSLTAPTTSAMALAKFNVLDTTTNTSLPATGTPYSGPVAGLQSEYLYTGVTT